MRGQQEKLMAKIKERERSLKEEHVDGGYLVTLGTYIGPEDFNKGIVRQLQVCIKRLYASGRSNNGCYHRLSGNWHPFGVA